MADDNNLYVDEFIDENGVIHKIKDSALTERVDEIEENGAGNSGNSQTSMKIYNVYDKKYYSVWVGTREAFNNVNPIDAETIYFVGTVPGGEDDIPTDETYYTIRTNLTNCSISGNLLNTNVMQVLEGASFNENFIIQSRYTLNMVSIKMNGVDITEQAYDEEDNSISINNISGNITITATAIIPLQSISITPQIDQSKPNIIGLRANLTPPDATNTEVQWKLATSNTMVRLVNINGWSATLEILPSADNDQITVTCTSVFENISGTYSTTVTYTTPSSSDPEPEPIDTNTYIDFTGEEDVKEILIGAGYGSGGEITIEQALINPSAYSSTSTQSTLFNGKTITSFNTWRYFTKSHFNVSQCSNLTQVTLPLLSNTSIFSSEFGLNGTNLTSITIPEGYTQFGAATGQYTANPLPSTASSVIWPSTMESFGFSLRELSITELDLSNTNVTTLIKQFCTELHSLTTVKFPSTLTNITWSQIFRECENLSRVEFGENYTGPENIDDAKYLFYDIVASRTYQPVTLVFHSATPPVFRFLKSGTQTKQRRFNILVPQEYLTTYQTAWGTYVGTTDNQPINSISAIEDEV